MDNAERLSKCTLSANGWFSGVQQVHSPNYDSRPKGAIPELLVIHNISLPPFSYGSDAVAQLFTNTLDSTQSPFFKSILHLRVSSHFFIRRNGQLLQFVSVYERAWHAGISCWHGKKNCNDFSIGIELEGCDFEAFTEVQYEVLIHLSKLLARALPLTTITGHSCIAPSRKTDPGHFFDWDRLAESVHLITESYPTS